MTIIYALMIIAILGLFIQLCRSSRPSEYEKMSTELERAHLKELRKKAQQQAEKNGKNYYDLLFNNICPLCGEELETKLYGSYDQFSDHKCVKCGFTTFGEVLV